MQMRSASGEERDYTFALIHAPCDIPPCNERAHCIGYHIINVRPAAERLQAF